MYCSLVMLTDCTFQYNLAQYGALYIYYDFYLWDYETNSEEIDNLYSKYTDVIVIDNCEFMQNTAYQSSEIASALTVISDLPVNVKVSNSKFIGNNSAWNSETVLI